MKTKLLSIALIGIFAVTFFSLPSCQKNSNDLPMSDETLSADHKSSQQARPFKGSIDYVVDTEIDLTCECSDPLVIGNYFLGTGNITHMGNVTSESIPCVEYILNGENIVGYSVESQCATFVAANGDELFTTVDPYVMMLDLNCFCSFSGPYTTTITGGTGRFENASGSAGGTVYQSLETGVVSITIDGEIYY
jgi:hypothetical protein